MVDNFYPYSQEKLGFDKGVTIIFQSDKENASRMLGKTAYYDPQNYEIALYVDGRHPKDILRSLSHELVHHAQNCRGDFQAPVVTDVGYAQKDPHLRKMEREAYTKGNLIFRDFEDLIKTGKKDVDIDFTKSGEPKMSLKEWKNNELNMLLMKKWGLLQEQKDSPEAKCKAEGNEWKDGECLKLNEAEDTEGEETYHYAEDEGADRKREGRLEAHLAAIDHHLHNLRDDMVYDEDRERRHEKGTHFGESKEELEEGAVGEFAKREAGALAAKAKKGALKAAKRGGKAAARDVGGRLAAWGKSPEAFTGTEKEEEEEIKDVQGGKGLEENQEESVEEGFLKKAVGTGLGLAAGALAGGAVGKAAGAKLGSDLGAGLGGGLGKSVATSATGAAGSLTRKLAGEKAGEIGQKMGSSLGQTAGRELGTSLGKTAGGVAGAVGGGMAGHALSDDDKEERGRREDGDEEESETPPPGVKVTDPEHLTRTTAKLPAVKRESTSRKISVREAKEITRRVIERIKKENK